MVKIADLIDPRKAPSTKRWVIIRASETLMGIAIALTVAILYQVGTHRAVDVQLAWITGSVYGSLAALAGASYHKKDNIPGPPQ